MSDPIEWSRIHNPNGPPTSQTWRHITRPLLAIVSVDMGRLHMSVSHRDRVPTWEELGIARDALLPENVFLCVPFPPRRYWLNYNHRVLHLWAFHDRELQEQFRWEGEQAQKHGFGEPTYDALEADKEEERSPIQVPPHTPGLSYEKQLRDEKVRLGVLPPAAPEADK